MTLRTLNYGNYGIFLIMGNAGFCPSAVGNGMVCFSRGLAGGVCWINQACKKAGELGFL